MEITRRGLLIKAFVAVPLVMAACGAPAAAPTAAPSKAEKPAATAAPAKGKQPPIVIAQITQLTGGQAIIGEWWRAGVKMAVTEWNEKGGVNGREIDLQVEDDGSTPTGGINAFNKLIAEKKPVGMIGTLYSNSIMAAEPTIRKAGIPVLTGASAPPVTAVGNSWLFRIRTSDAILTKLISEFAVKDLGAKKPGTIHVTGDFGVSAAQFYKEYFQALGAPLVADESYNPDDKDMTAQVLNLQRAGVDVATAAGFANDAALVMTAIYQNGNKFKLIGNDSFVITQVVNMAKEAAEGKYGVMGWLHDSGDPKGEAWIKRFPEFTKSPPNDHSASAYDGTNILLTAIQKAGTEPDAIRKALLETRGFPGIQGEYSFNAKGDGMWHTYLVQTQSGQPKLIKKLVEPFKP